MSDNSFAWGFICGVFFTLIGWAAFDIDSPSVISQRSKCEAKLPRNQHCVIVALPQKPKDAEPSND